MLETPANHIENEAAGENGTGEQEEQKKKQVAEITPVHTQDAPKHIRTHLELTRTHLELT